MVVEQFLSSYPDRRFYLISAFCIMTYFYFSILPPSFPTTNFESHASLGISPKISYVQSVIRSWVSYTHPWISSLMGLYLMCCQELGSNQKSVTSMTPGRVDLPPQLFPSCSYSQPHDVNNCPLRPTPYNMLFLIWS